MIDYKKITGVTQLSGKVAVVTGATKGIGQACAKLLAMRGADVALVGRSGDVNAEADKLAKEYGVKTLGIRGDVSVESDVDNMVKRTVETFGKVDIVCAVAGITRLESAERITMDDWDAVMNTNCRGAFMTVQKFGAKMIEAGNGGHVVIMGSQGGLVALDKHVAYTMSKAALIGMTKSLAYEWAKYGINVNCVSPTVVLTEMGEKAWAGEVGEAMKAKIPANRFAYPDEIAAAVLFLAGDESQMITGENLVIDGGYTIY